MSNRILVVGANGMLGGSLFRYLSKIPAFEVLGTVRSTEAKFALDQQGFAKIASGVDVTDFQTITKVISDFKPNYVLNCVGVIKQLDASRAPVPSIQINSLLPHQLANACDEADAKLIHFSTDCVFAGTKGGYLENDITDATDLYGKSKSLGEITAKNFFNIRTSIIGKEIKGYKSLYDWFLSQEKNSKINGFTNHLWNGLTTRAYGHILISIIENKIKLPNKIHICPKNLITKYEMLKLFNDKNPSKKIIIKPISARIKINRTISTKYKKISDLIWKKSKYKKTPTINELIKEI